MVILTASVANSQSQNFPSGGTTAYPVTITGGTSGGIPCFTSSTVQASSAALGAGVLVAGGGAGSCVAASSLTDNGTVVTGAEPIRLGAGTQTTPSYSFSTSTGDGWYERASGILDLALGGTMTPHEIFAGGYRQGSNGVFGFTASSNNAAASFDTGISRDAAGAVDIGNGTSGDKSGTLNAAKLSAATYATTTNCSSGASPAVCGSAAAGSIAVPAGTNVALQVNTTAVTANSQIFVQSDETLGTKLSVTCNSTLASLITEPVVSARTPATSFTVTISGTTTTNPVCLSYFIVN
jgi:hypothetical protein